jgi:hypothetical protein
MNLVKFDTLLDLLYKKLKIGVLRVVTLKKQALSISDKYMLSVSYCFQTYLCWSKDIKVCLI